MGAAQPVLSDNDKSTTQKPGVVKFEMEAVSGI